MSIYLKGATDSYVKGDLVSAQPVARLQTRSVSPIRRFEGGEWRYLVFQNPTRSEGKGIYQQEGYELPLPPGKAVSEGYTLGKGALYGGGKLEGTTEKVRAILGVKIQERRESLEVAGSLNSFGDVCYLEGEYTQAIDYYTLALNIWRTKLGPNHPQVAHSLSCLGSAYCSQSKYSQALDLYTQALEIWQIKLESD